jgi:hypothetical protein
LRGCAASCDLAAGSLVMSVPEQLLITYSTAAESDFGKALSKLPGEQGAACAVFRVVTATAVALITHVVIQQLYRMVMPSVVLRQQQLQCSSCWQQHGAQGNHGLQAATATHRSQPGHA